MAKVTMVLATVVAIMLASVIPAAAQIDGLEGADDAWAYGSFGDGGTVKVMLVVRMDAGSRSTANTMVQMIEDNPGEFADMITRPKVNRNHGLKGCAMITGKIDLGDGPEPGVMMACADGADLYILLGNDKDAAIDVVEELQDTGDIVPPAGWIDMSGML